MSRERARPQDTLRNGPALALSHPCALLGAGSVSSASARAGPGGLWLPRALGTHLAGINPSPFGERRRHFLAGWLVSN